MHFELAQISALEVNMAPSRAQEVHHGPKVVAKRPSKASKSAPKAPTWPQSDHKTSSMATKLAPRSPTKRPSGFGVGVKSHAWLFGVRFYMPVVQHGALVSQKRTNMALRIEMLLFDRHPATSTSMRLWVFIPMNVARLYAI